MKTTIKILSIFTLTAFLASCGGEAVDQDLKALTEKRDSIKTEIATMTEELMELETQIAKMDDDFTLLQVTAIEASISTFDHYFTVQGTIETDMNAQVFPESQGMITSIKVSEGQQVSKGQTILTLDTELIRKNIAEVETQYELAVEIYDRQKRLWEQNIGSEVQYLEAKTNKERLEGTLATLNKQVSMGTVRAPFSGVIDQIGPKIGEMASPAFPVARIVSLDKMYVTADVSEYYVNSVEEGMNIDVILPGIDTLDAAIDRVGRFIKPENRTFEVSAELENSPSLRPNMFCALRVNDAHYDSTMVIQSSMVQQDVSGKDFIYLLTREGNKYSVKKQPITTAESFGNEVRVSAGLKPGDLIVDKGARRVIDGQEVELFVENASVATK
ncbi:MAG: efflux RND transporter periplasmic adaptor subunit [Flavobacteriales bacterium]|nr:efflux RND transporter periplasmic adaptor subunit [Flavobacteriales bacterium]